MRFTVDQENAISEFKGWFLDHRVGVFRMFGYAGTGKTTLARHLASFVDGPVAYAAYTGKAASAMVKKGCVDARTIHSWIYTCEIVVEIHKGSKGVEHKKKRLVWHLKSKEDMERRSKDRDEYYEQSYSDKFQIWDARLIIVDECSMVDEKLAKDLMSFGVPIVVIGDPAQLPPVNFVSDAEKEERNGYFMLGNVPPDAMLTEITRQAAKSEIIRYSMFIREGGERKTWATNAEDEVRFCSVSELTIDEGLKFDQIICGTNKTRHKVNKRCRDVLGFTKLSALPVKGDKLICLKNDRGVMNGEMFFVVNDPEIVERYEGQMIKLMLSEIDENGRAEPIERVILTEEFEKVDDYRVKDDLKEFKFGFGYAITTHKAQGSQFDSVLVFDESYIFESHEAGAARRWLYTAVTRAAKQLTVVREGVSGKSMSAANPIAAKTS